MYILENFKKSPALSASEGGKNRRRTTAPRFSSLDWPNGLSFRFNAHTFHHGLTQYETKPESATKR